MKERAKIIRQIRMLVWIMIIALVVSGVTAYPLEAELSFLSGLCERFSIHNDFSAWIERAREGIVETNRRYPFIAYGSDWLGFAHLIIALAFVGVLREPVLNRWIVDWALIASLLVIPHALCFGALREIPFFHRIIDCMFGVVAAPLLFKLRRMINGLSHP